MLKNLSANITYGTIALFLIAICFIYLWDQRWDTYEAWIIACSLSAFIMCWIADKKKGVPMGIIYTLSILGGFIGAWLGMFGFWYQVRNIRFWIVLIFSVIFQGAFIRAFL